jgi:hypothetical protein
MRAQSLNANEREALVLHPNAINRGAAAALLMPATPIAPAAGAVHSDLCRRRDTEQ